MNSILVRKAKCARGIELITRIVTPTDAEQCVYPANPKNKVAIRILLVITHPAKETK